MKIFSSEFAQAHDLLTFAYAIYAEREEGDELEEIYAKGFLPYSGSPDAKNLLYMARSARILLPEFTLDSECRRVATKFDGQFESLSTPMIDFKITEEFIQFWLAYYEAVHPRGTMPRARLAYILGSGFITDIVTYLENGKPAAYVLEVRSGGMTHVWYTSYALHLVKKSFGMWLIIDSVRQASERGQQYFYLGTVYKKFTEYKTNFPHLEFWDGTAWRGDAKNTALKKRIHSDEVREVRLIDEWKEEHQTFGKKPSEV